MDISMTNKPKNTNITPLAKIASILNCYIIQDADGYVALWTHKPKLNERLGYWELDEKESILLEPVIKPYRKDWRRSLITPRTLDALRSKHPKKNAKKEGAE